MWKDLTLEQKAEIMKMSVANGVTDINDIQQLYDGSVGHRFDDAGRIITLADLPREYVQRYGDINVVTPKGVRMPLSQAYRDYNQTPINVNDVPGLTDYLIRQNNPDIQEQAHINKIVADREIRQRNNLINGPIFDKEKIYNRVPGDMWQAVISDENNQSVGANRGITRSLFSYYFNPDDAVESRLQRYEKYKDLSMEEVMNAGMEFDRMWKKYGLDSIRNNPILSRKMTELESKMHAPHVLQHEDAKDLYLGLPQRNNTMKDAEYNPTNGTLRNGKYVSYMRDPAFINGVIMPSYNHLKRNFIDKEWIKRGLYKDHSYNMNISLVKEITPRGYARVEFPFLNNATLSGGIDPQRGEYASIFDTWDYNTNIMGTPGDNVGKYIGGEPFDIYDRYYLDDYYGINSKPQDNGYYGGYLPELLVSNKKALGGHLFDKGGSKNKNQTPKYRYGLIEQALVEGGAGGKFRVTSSKRKPNEAGNKGSHSAHTYTLENGDPAAIDIVPVGISGQELLDIMASPLMQATLAKYGFDILNESSKEMMSKNAATGQHLHIGKGIKGQQGKGQIFGGSTWGVLGRNTGGAYASSGNPTYTSIPSSSTQTSEPFGVKAPKDEVNPWVKFLAEVQQSTRPASPAQEEESTPALTAQSNLTDFSSLNTDPRVEEAIQQANSQPALAYMPDITSDPLWNDSYDLFEPNTLANGGHLLRRGGPYDIEARSDNTANVVQPVNRMIQIKQQDTPARRKKETREYKARQERAKYTPANPRQASIGPYKEKTVLDKQGGRLYAEAEQRRKAEEARDEASTAFNAILKPLFPSTYYSVYDAYKKGKVNNAWDAFAAPYLTGNWAEENPGDALLMDIAVPLAAGKTATIANNIANRNLFTYKYIEPWHYIDKWKRAGNWAKHILMDSKLPTITETNIANKKLINTPKFKEVYDDTKVYRDDAYRKWLGIPERTPLYIDNGDGTWSYNLRYLSDNGRKAVVAPQPYPNGTAYDTLTGNGATVGATINPNTKTVSIIDPWDVHPFSRMANVDLSAKASKVADKVYKSLYNPIFKNRFAYEYLGGHALNRMRYGFKGLDNLSNLINNNIINRMRGINAAKILGGKDFVLKQDIPYRAFRPSTIGELAEKGQLNYPTASYKSNLLVDFNRVGEDGLIKQSTPIEALEGTSIGYGPNQDNYSNMLNFIAKDIMPRLKAQGHSIHGVQLPSIHTLNGEESLLDRTLMDGHSDAGAMFVTAINEALLRGPIQEQDYGLLLHEIGGHGIRHNLHPEYGPTTREAMENMMRDNMQGTRSSVSVNLTPEVFSNEEKQLLTEAYHDLMSGFKKGFKSEQHKLDEAGAVNTQFRSKISQANNNAVQEALNEAVRSTSDGTLLDMLIDQGYTGDGTINWLSKITGKSEDELLFMNTDDLNALAQKHWDTIHKKLAKIRNTMLKVGGIGAPIGVGISSND